MIDVFLNKVFFQIRSIGMTITMVQMGVTLFILTKYFPILYPIIGLDTCMWFFALISLLGALFCVFILPETNCKNINV